MLTRNVSVILGLLVLTGCAAYTPPPLTAEHPAHPEAVAASERPRSSTLSYGPADRPAPQATSSMAQRSMPHDTQPGMRHDMHGSRASQPESQQTVTGEGTVVAVVPSSDQIVVDHGAIKGFMDAMTMGYAVKPVSLLDELAAGDRIRFTIDTQNKAIVEIEKVPE